MQVRALVRDVLDLLSREAKQPVRKIGKSPRGRDLLADLRDFPVVGIAAGKAVTDQSNALLDQPSLGLRLPVFLGPGDLARRCTTHPNNSPTFSPLVSPCGRG